MALLRSVATVGGYTMMSRVLGFVRDMLTAQFLGAGPLVGPGGNLLGFSSGYKLSEPFIEGELEGGGGPEGEIGAGLR